MSTSISPIEEALATRWELSPEHLRATVRAAVFRKDADKASDADLLAVLMLARQHDLNPFTGEIQAFLSEKRGMQVIIPHSGWTRIVTRDPRFERVEMEEHFDETGAFLGTTSRWFLKGHSEPVAEFSAWLKEWFRDTDQWRGKPRHMCGIKAYNHGARRAMGLGQVYDEDDAERIRAERHALREPRSVAEAQAARVDPPPTEPEAVQGPMPAASLFPE